MGVSGKEVEETRKELMNLLDMKSLKTILDAFTTTTGLTANIVDISGRSIFSRKDNDKCCKFCSLIAGMKGGRQRCESAYERAGHQAALFGEPYIFRCPSGLIEWAAPIVVNGRNLGSIICGQVLMWEPEEFFWIELREMNKSLTSDFKELFQAVEELSVVSGEMVQAASNLLYIVSNYIARSGWQQRESEQELSKHKTMLNEEYESRKKLEEQLDQIFLYSMDKEAELMDYLKECDHEKMENCLSLVANEIILGSKGNMETMRTRCMELIVMASRNAVSKNVPQEWASQTNSGFFKKILDSHSIDDLGNILTDVFEIYYQEIAGRNTRPEVPAIRIMKNYMQQNFSVNLTLDQIADAAYLSSSYASRVFKKEMGCSIMDYLLTIRMKEARRLLKETKENIEEIAHHTGYSEASYFTKVFRKTEGMTPTQFRHK